MVTPGLYCGSDSLIEALRSYVRGGGHLLSTFRSFFCDENVTIRTQQQLGGLTDVFGMTYDNFTVPENVPQAKQWMELLRADGDTEVLLRYGHAVYSAYAAVTCHTYGKGKAAYIGTMLEKTALDAVLEWLLPGMGISLPPYRWPLVIKQGENPSGETIRYVLNYSSARQSFRVEEGGTELLSRKHVSSGDSFGLEPWGVGIFTAE